MFAYSNDNIHVSFLQVICYILISYDKIHILVPTNLLLRKESYYPVACREITLFVVEQALVVFHFALRYLC